jgi:hypothetical protein
MLLGAQKGIDHIEPFVNIPDVVTLYEGAEIGFLKLTVVSHERFPILSFHCICF